jgi:shikimate dehydrogenase
MSTDRYAVVGNPIEHSLSPRIHALFAEQTGQDLIYTARLGQLEHFAEDVRAWFREGLRGLNVTVPFKEPAFRMVDQHSARAAHAGAVNTIWSEADGRLTGDNTDGAGFLRDLSARLRFDPAGQRILILGAGGATRGLLEPLLRSAPARLVIANRTAETAQGLAAAFGDLAPTTQLEGSGLDAIPPGPFDLLINATAAGLGQGALALPGGLLDTHSLAYDLMYGPGARPFLDWARNQHAGRVSDGLGMLVEQAAEAFAIWRGLRPDTASVLQTLRAENADP